MKKKAALKIHTQSTRSSRRLVKEVRLQHPLDWAAIQTITHKIRLNPKMLCS